MQKRHFSQLLLQDKVVTPVQIQDALKAQAQSGELIGSVLFSRKILTEEQVVHYLSKVYEVPGVMVSTASPNPILREKIPYEIAIKYRIFPLKLEKNVLSIGAINPQDMRMIQEVEFMTTCRLKIFVAMECTLRERIHFFYGYGDRKEISISMGNSQQEPMVIETLSSEPSSKEIARDLFTQELDDALSQMKPTLPQVSPDWPQIMKRERTLLVVDDDASVRNALTDILKKKKYNVIAAARGREAVQKIQTIRPDLIILDAMLPEIHGFKICKTLKESEKYRSIPVLIITAIFTGWRFAMDVKVQYGADEVMEKPFKMTELLAKVKQLLDESGAVSHIVAQKDQALSLKVEELIEKGIGALKEKRIEEAISFFQEGIEVDQFHPMLHYYLGKCVQAQEDVFGAIAHLERAIALDPVLFVGVKDLAVLYQKNAFKMKAVEMWERALQICPNPGLREKIKQNLIRLL